MAVTVKTPEQIERMRVAGRLAAEVLELMREHVKPGVTTEELDQIAHEHIVRVQKAIPANVGYKGFPKTLCTSVNHVICHGIPNPGKVLKDGDIIISMSPSSRTAGTATPAACISSASRRCWQNAWSTLRSKR